MGSRHQIPDSAIKTMTLFVIVLYHFLIISNIDGNTVMAFNFVVVFVSHSVRVVNSGQSTELLADKFHNIYQR